MAVDLNIKILIVDDFSMMRRVVKNILLTLGFKNIIEEEDGENAYSTLQIDHDIALVITDWHMPNMNGLELLRKIRAERRTKKLPVLMITAEALPENAMAAIKSGVNGFIVKPFDAATMKIKLDKVFNS